MTNTEVTEALRATLAESTQITVYHNVATDEVGRLIAMMDGYQPGHPLVPVAKFRSGVAFAVAGFTGVLEFAFREFNVGDGALAVAYREAGNRSLSVGDVVQVGSGWFACASFGWDPIDTPEWFALGVKRHGTTSLNRDSL